MRGRRGAIACTVIGLSLITVGVNAQPNGQVEREEMYRRYLEFPKYVKGGKVDPHWMADGNSFWYAEGAPENTVIWKVDPIANIKEPMFDSARLQKVLATIHDPAHQSMPFDTFSFVDEEETTVRFTVEEQEFDLRLDTYEMRRVPPESEADRRRRTPQLIRKAYYYYPEIYELPSPDRRWFVGVKDHNLYLRSPLDDGITWLTTDGVEDFDWGAWARFPPMWSPDSRKLAIRKTDWRNVPKTPIIQWLTPTEEVEWVRGNPRARGPLYQTELFIIDILSGKKIRIDTGPEPDQHLHISGWLPDSSALLLLKANSNVTVLQLMVADAAKGKSRVILTETGETAVRYLYFPWWDRLVTFLEKGKRLIWMSERDGWDHPYLYELDGALIRQLTKGSFPVEQVVSVDESNGWVYLMASDDRARPFDTHLYRVDLDSGQFIRLTQTTGRHQVELSPSKEFFLDTHSTSNRSQSVDLRRADGTLLRTLSKANTQALKGIRWRAPEEFSVKAADGKTDIYGVIYKPYDFDGRQRYPVIEIIHGGRVVSRNFVPNQFGTIAQALAQLGFITFMIEASGSHNHVAALKQLTNSRTFMDRNHVGIFGHSNGGRLAIRAMLVEPDVYRVGVATAPVGELIDHHYQIVASMDLPENNPEGYERSSTLRLAENLKGELLIIHGTSDLGSPFSHTMKLADAFIKAGKKFDLVVIPGGDHGPTVARAYWFGAVARHFQEHLKP